LAQRLKRRNEREYDGDQHEALDEACSAQAPTSY